MAKMAYAPSGHKNDKKIYLTKLLKTCTHVFIRDTARSHSLQPPYRGPFKAINKHDNFSTVIIKNEEKYFIRQNKTSNIRELRYLEVSPSNTASMDIT